MNKEKKKKIINIILYILVGIVIGVSSSLLSDLISTNEEEISSFEETSINYNDEEYISNEENIFYYTGDIIYNNQQYNYLDDNPNSSSNIADYNTHFVSLLSGLESETILKVLINNAGKDEVEYVLEYLYDINNLNVDNDNELYAIDFLEKTIEEQLNIINCKPENVKYLHTDTFYTTSQYAEWSNAFGQAVRVSGLVYINHPNTDPFSAYYTYDVYTACRQDYEFINGVEE